MPEHVAIPHTKVGIFICRIPWHFIYHGTLQMYHFVMRQGQNVVLTVIVAHGKGHSVMIALTIQRIQLHVFTEIMHPAHIPFKGEA